MEFNGDGEIAFEEFVEFWEIVKGSGHSEDEIKEEVSTGHAWRQLSSKGYRWLSCHYKAMLELPSNILSEII